MHGATPDHYLQLTTDRLLDHNILHHPPTGAHLAGGDDAVGVEQLSQREARAGPPSPPGLRASARTGATCVATITIVGKALLLLVVKVSMSPSSLLPPRLPPPASHSPRRRRGCR